MSSFNDKLKNKMKTKVKQLSVTSNSSKHHRSNKIYVPYEIRQLIWKKLRRERLQRNFWNLELSNFLSKPKKIESQNQIRRIIGDCSSGQLLHTSGPIFLWIIQNNNETEFIPYPSVNQLCEHYFPDVEKVYKFVTEFTRPVPITLESDNDSVTIEELYKTFYRIYLSERSRKTKMGLGYFTAIIWMLFNGHTLEDFLENLTEIFEKNVTSLPEKYMQIVTNILQQFKSKKLSSDCNRIYGLNIKPILRRNLTVQLF